MKRLSTFLLLFVLPAVAVAQQLPTGLTSQRQPIAVTASALHQTYQEGDDEVTETSFPVSFYVPMGRNVAFTLSTSPAMASARQDGLALADLSGASDVLMGMAFSQRLGSGSAVFNLGVNLPSGKRKLSFEEFATSAVMSRSFYALQVPLFGQGFNVLPGLTYAFPLGDRLALGLGASYQYKGEFRPIEELGAYDPGDELLLTAGLDVRFTPRLSLAADVSYTTYAADQLAGDEVFGAGDRVSVLGRLEGRLGVHGFSVTAGHRQRGQNEILVDGTLVTEEEATIPNQTTAEVFFQPQFGNTLLLGLSVGGRYFHRALERVDGTLQQQSRRLLDLGVFPELRLGRRLSLLGRFVYTYGDFTELSGYEAGGGLSVRI